MPDVVHFLRSRPTLALLVLLTLVSLRLGAAWTGQVHQWQHAGPSHEHESPCMWCAEVVVQATVLEPGEPPAMEPRRLIRPMVWRRPVELSFGSPQTWLPAPRGPPVPG